MPGLTETTRTSAGVRTRALTTAGEGPTLVLLHGFTDSADTWRPVLRELEAQGRRAIAVDLPGSGRAEPLARGPVLATLDAFVADLVREEGTGGPVVLAGNSLGGVLALRAACDPGLPLAAVAPLAPAGFGFHPRVDHLGRLLEWMVPLLRITYRLPYPGWLVRDVAARFFAIRLGMNRADPELARRYASHFRHGMADLRRVGATARLLTGELEAGAYVDLHEVAVPVLLIWGAQDPVCDVRGAQSVLDTIPGSRLTVLERSGHLPQVQQPMEVAELLAALPAPALSAA